jgi:hypothetical protein
MKEMKMLSPNPKVTTIYRSPSPMREVGNLYGVIPSLEHTYFTEVKEHADVLSSS